jgi:FtsZ-interacting cell division protein ZipA
LFPLILIYNKGNLFKKNTLFSTFRKQEIFGITLLYFCKKENMILLEITMQDMQTIIIILGIVVVLVLGTIVYLMTEFKALKSTVDQKRPVAADNSQLRLQAYERLTLLTDRISLKNLVTRMHDTQFTARELAAGLIETIRTEYEHNITQQNYVNPEVWKAVTNLKEQNIYIINELTATLPPQATALDCSRAILQYATTENAELSSIVLNAIQYEVKKQ